MVAKPQVWTFTISQSFVSINFIDTTNDRFHTYTQSHLSIILHHSVVILNIRSGFHSFAR
mgnify:FL=1